MQVTIRSTWQHCRGPQGLCLVLKTKELPKQTIFFFPLQLTEEETDFQEFCLFNANVSAFLFFGDDTAFYETKILKAVCIRKVLIKTNFYVTFYSMC